MKKKAVKPTKKVSTGTRSPSSAALCSSLLGAPVTVAMRYGKIKTFVAGIDKRKGITLMPLNPERTKKYSDREEIFCLNRVIAKEEGFNFVKTFDAAIECIKKGVMTKDDRQKIQEAYLGRDWNFKPGRMTKCAFRTYRKAH